MTRLVGAADQTSATASDRSDTGRPKTGEQPDPHTTRCWWDIAEARWTCTGHDRWWNDIELRWDLRSDPGQRQ